MTWKTDFRSLYYRGAPEPDDLVLVPKETALLVIDVQNTYLERPDRATLSPEEQRRYDLWTPFHERMHQSVIPGTAEMLQLGAQARDRMPVCPHRLPHQGWPRPLALPEDAGLEQPALAQGRGAIAARPS